MDDDATGQLEGDEDSNPGQDLTAQLVKKLVRYAMACEYARQPIRREGIREKVLGPHSRLFKRVFDAAQKQLIQTFGMEMREWPTKDKATLTATQRRKAISKSQNTQVQATTNAYILVSILPDKYRDATVIPPSKVQSPAGESSYMGIVSMLISIITLSGGELSEPRLRRHLTRLNLNDMMPSLVPSDRNTPVEKSEAVLQRMVKQGYLVRVVDKNAEEGETTTWYVGPRGKMEVGNEAIAGIVRTVYGGSSDELEKKLQASLGVKDRKTVARGEDVDNEMEDAGEAEGANEAGPSGRQRVNRQDDEEEEAEEEDGEEEQEQDVPPPGRRSQRRQRHPRETEEDINGATPLPPSGRGTRRR
ncbi:MAGE-domain-containing protein [Thozetella sp. PMI_491]|nr:MAGE-domain-containing protein [Thozetella sp. PMI_491]